MPLKLENRRSFQQKYCSAFISNCITQKFQGDGEIFYWRLEKLKFGSPRGNFFELSTSFILLRSPAWVKH